MTNIVINLKDHAKVIINPEKFIAMYSGEDGIELALEGAEKAVEIPADKIAPEEQLRLETLLSPKNIEQVNS